MNNLVATTVIDGLFVLAVWIVVANAVKKISSSPSKKRRSQGVANPEPQPTEAEAEEMKALVKQSVDAQFYRRQRLDEEFAEKSRIAAREAAGKGQWPPREA